MNFPSERPASASSVRINPTYTSSVFSHYETTPSSAGFNPHSEINLPTRGKVQRIEKSGHVLPTVNEWKPKASDVNNPDAHHNMEKNAIKIAQQKAERDALNIVEHKEKLTHQTRAGLKQVDEKFQTRLDHKKPTDEAKKAHQEAQNQYITETVSELGKLRSEKANYAQELAGDMEARSIKRHNDNKQRKEEERNVTGFKLGNHKSVLSPQEVKEAQQTQMKAKEAVRQNEVDSKKAEVKARLDEHKAAQNEAIGQYEDSCQQKVKKFDEYKVENASYAPIKKNKGLMTVKI